ncbi:NAD(P)/FAD-dependent oxidoreductase [Streptomyces cavernicola]|uniref:FAD-dependent oxidoreductase n=1 Tax=Streptomyces cavernicola TaxID=3043613 RepID=A0ABT6SMP9_9ACTN|nr:FAD-dependent oxidoreductase [Streptomyces sp. B-S-A6]MDI3409465.1 FAD-dependent oxidoreductase [Streptomyces sp. B-S-A6]
MNTVAVIGGSLAGLSAARSLRGQGYEGRLVVVGEEIHRPYDRPPLSKEFLKGTLPEEDLYLEAEDDELDAEWLLGTKATGLDLRDRSIRLSDGRDLAVDGVVVATGAAARHLPGGWGMTGVHVVRTLDDARALQDDLARGGRLVVVGGGFVGAEVASTARELGLDVTFVVSGPAPLSGALGPAMAATLAPLHADHGVRVLSGTGVQGVTGTPASVGVPARVQAVQLADGRSIPADIVVVGIGASPHTDWLLGSGVELDDGVRCWSDGTTNIPEVVAVGDCAAWYEPALGRHRRVEHWTGANERPATAVAALLSGGTAQLPPPKPPYFWSEQYGVRIQFAGHAARADSVTIEDGSEEDRSFVAVYRSAGQPVAVLGVNRAKLFTRWRKQLAAAAVGVGTA